MSFSHRSFSVEHDIFLRVILHLQSLIVLSGPLNVSTWRRMDHYHPFIDLFLFWVSFIVIPLSPASFFLSTMAGRRYVYFSCLFLTSCIKVSHLGLNSAI
jgi:hypothetical protein